MSEIKEKLEEISNSIKNQSDDLKETIDNYSSTNRNIFIFFMLFLLTIFSLASKTIDKDLLVNSLMEFPIIKLQMPTTYFYGIVPLIIVVIHFIVLFNLAEHMERLNTWMNEGDREKKGLLLRAYIFNHLIRYEDSYFLKFVRWLTLFFLPLALLLFLQLKFLPYHDNDIFYKNITIWHRIFIFLDFIMLFWFWRKIVTHKNMFDYVFFIIFHLSIISFISLIFFTIPKTNEEEIFGEKISDLIHRNLYIQNEILVKKYPPIELFLKNDKSEEEIYLEKSKPLDLRGRDLRFGDFSGCKFYRANLENADFINSNLILSSFLYANLKNTNLVNTLLFKINLFNSNLMGAKLTNNNLMGAKLEGTDLHTKYLDEVSFWFANTKKLNLKGIDLSKINLLHKTMFLEPNYVEPEYEYINGILTITTKYDVGVGQIYQYYKKLFNENLKNIDIRRKELCQNIYITKEYLTRGDDINYFKNLVNRDCLQEFKNKLIKEFGNDILKQRK